MEVDYDNVQQKLIDRDAQIVRLSHVGFVLTNDDICRNFAMTILNHTKNVKSRLTDEQNQKLFAMYNELIVMP